MNLSVQPCIYISVGSWVPVKTHFPCLDHGVIPFKLGGIVEVRFGV